LIHCAHIFNNCPGLKPREEDKMEVAKLIDDDDKELSIEERVFRMWMNSLDLGEDFYINNLI